MTLRSTLFATVALPLSAVLMTGPALADGALRTYEVAQASDDEQRQLQEQQAAEEAQRAAEEQAAQEAQRAAEQQAAEEAQRAAEQQAAEEAQRAAEEQAAQEAQRAAEQQAAEEAQRAAEQQAAEEAQRAAEQQAAQAAQEAQRAAEEAQRAAEQQAAQEAQRAAEQQAAEEAQRAAEQQAGEEAQRAAEQKAAEEAQRAAEEQAAQEAQRAAEQKAVEDAQRAAEQQQQQEQPVVSEGEQPATSDQPATAQDQQQQPAGGEQQPVVTEGEQPAQENQPATADGQQQPADQQNAGETATQPVVVPEIVDTRSQEEKQAIAADPSRTSETVVLPVENGAAVLDSDKDADNRGGQTSREERRKQREAQRTEEQNIKPPTSDAEAQATATAVETKVIRQQIEEKGRRIKETPEFELPARRDAEAGGTTINNNTVNNTINNISIVQQNDNRTVLRVDDRYVVRSDDRPRLRRDAEDSFYEELSRGRVRETIVRSNGVRLVTIYNAYGDVIQRTRIGRDGEEYLLVFAPEADRSRPPLVRDAGDDLPPMRLRIPVSDYIVDTSEDLNRDYYEFLAEPPVERVERTYSIDEVRYSARLRDKVRRIDLDTITFASGSAEVPMSQAKTLRKVADAMTKVLDRDPGETFLIEGHTDAVGSDQKNLILSDQRAEAVAALLTDVYGIPPENLVPQGYGERYLKVRTQASEQQNRRVTVRRVTSLVRPVAKAQ
ncbi:MAG: hypothetical protein BGN83_15740 [Rhizobium sp. 63-7]|nr:MAG: hypothetical protein BGN83_15740 [Rhizobium sp. 63-7]